MHYFCSQSTAAGWCVVGGCGYVGGYDHVDFCGYIEFFHGCTRGKHQFHSTVGVLFYLHYMLIYIPVINSVEDFYVHFEDCVGFSIHGTFLHNLQNGHRNLQHYFQLVPDLTFNYLANVKYPTRC